MRCTLECISVYVERLRVHQIDLWERGRVVVKGSWAEIDLLPSPGSASVDYDPVDSVEHLAADRHVGIRPEVHQERSG